MERGILEKERSEVSLAEAVILKLKLKICRTSADHPEEEKSEIGLPKPMVVTYMDVEDEITTADYISPVPWHAEYRYDWAMDEGIKIVIKMHRCASCRLGVTPGPRGSSD